nr:MAG: RNA-dependent RNA polymerase [Mbeech associated botourmia-like virus 29]
MISAKARRIGTPCSTRGSLVKALKRVTEVLSREFGLTRTFIPVVGFGCSPLRRSWEEYAGLVAGDVGRNKVKKRLLMTLKSCKRLFDVPCASCDKHMGEEAMNEWANSVGTEDVEGERRCRLYTEELKTHVRGLVSGWGRRLETARFAHHEPSLPSDVYVPDQQGCLEAARGEGGTISVLDSSYAGDPSLVRRGVAKQKGKFRVVTMQSARVKRVLRPVHNALYDHLTSFGWCVRGDVRDEDFLAVYDSTDEEIISGDYKAATDNIYHSAVAAIIEVLSEEALLSEEEREFLVGSFQDLRWISCKGVQHPIKRGSMMGNLVSFPLLCLLNKACHDIAAGSVYGIEARRVGRFNGDDCLFGGSREMYQQWRVVTARYGLIVNEEKTMISRKWADLNSQTFCLTGRRRISKPVLSFLLPTTNSPGEILTSVISGVKMFKPAVQLWVVNVLMRYEISVRGFSLSNIPSGWCKVLMKKKWFRRCVWDGPALEAKKPDLGRKGKVFGLELLPSFDRSFPTVLGPPPIGSFMSRVDSLCAAFSVAHTESISGVKVKPPTVRLDRREFASRDTSRPLPSTKFVGTLVEWGYLWPAELFSEVTARFPQILLSPLDCRRLKSLPYSPMLVLRHSYRVVRDKPSFPTPPSLSPRGPSLGSRLIPALLRRGLLG